MTKTRIEEESQLGPTKELDAGALFVLKSRGSWVHCGYHLTTAIVGPPVLSLPFTFAMMGWVPGVFCLAIGTMVTFYSYNLLSLVLERHEKLGQRTLRFRDMGTTILGSRWARYYVGPIQFSVCYAAVALCILLGGQSLKAIYILSTTNEKMKLYEFIVIFGGLMLLLAQIPSFHSLRHINLISLVLYLAYSICAVVGSIYIGKSKNATHKDYSLNSHGADLMYGIFNAIAITATTYGNGILPEIQATIAPPVKGKMFKGLCLCYTVTTTTFFSVAISGYWAFGNQAQSTIISNFIVDGKPLIPKWFILMTNVFTLLQVLAITLVYLQPTNEIFEQKFANPKSHQFSTRNVIPRLFFRSLSVVVATIIAAMFPFFGDIMAVIGAFGIIPLDFVLPMVFYNVTFQPSKRNPIFWINISIAVIFSALGVLGAISSVRQIILDSKTYHLFANV
ncbi:GABA transporter 1-like [Macadamia integrifolia]|uniref:GABA transporter 1-like n=2 Tax=Macadamia integrifolia TaxID=60698 RepID=UPI001C4E4D48|nr:GABA transporter 1-like [Macadamia integrifolia]